MNRDLLSDSAAREAIQDSLDESLIVEAAAGTGKTTALISRLVAILEKGKAEVSGIVAVTFTRKAAGELKLRLRQALDARVEEVGKESVDRRGRLEAAIQRLEEAQIGTIHSFCGEVLRERPVEAGVDPDFGGLSEEEAPVLFHRAFHGWIQEALEEMPEGLRRALSRLATERSFDGSSPLERLERAAWGLAEWRDFPTPWQRPDYDREAAIDGVAEDLLRLAEMARACVNPRDVLRQDLEPVVDLASWIERSERIGDRDYDALESRLLARPSPLRSKRKGRGSFADSVDREVVVATRERLVVRLEALRGLADAEVAASLQQELRVPIERYEDLKRSLGKLDFVDLLIRTRDLLRTHASVRLHLQERFSHIFVDEFQDTDPLQAEILLLLSADDPAESDWRAVRPVAGKLFLVGDPKQSIYRFRRADVALYQEIKERLVSQSVRVVHLRRSFRSNATLQAAVNFAFAPEMERDLEHGQAEYIALEEVRPAPIDQPALVALPIGRPYGRWNITKTQLESELPNTVGSFVSWLLAESGWRVGDPEGLREIRSEDVCILFRRYVSWGRDITRAYTRALEVRGVSHVLVGERTFHQREEVESLRAAMTAVEWPEDELAVFATLRGSLFSITDELLLRFRAVGSLHPFRCSEIASEDLETFNPILEALEFLAQLHQRRNRRPIVETLQSILEFTRAHAAFALRPAGHQVLANVQRVCELARSYEIGGGVSFRGFVDRLTAEAGQASGGQAPVIEEGAEGVRLMTVHSAKGLEFPVVILADLTANLASRNPSRHVDSEAGLCAQSILGWAPIELQANHDLEVRRDQMEGVRLAYVAATRAQDLLVVPVVGDAAQEGWLGPLNRALYPPRDRRRAAEQAPGCPAFGDVSVLERPQSFDRDGEMSVRPGQHFLQDSGHSVTWWDPAQLQLVAHESFGLRQAEILAPDEGDIEADRGLRRYEEWSRRRQDLLGQGRLPEHRVLTVTELEEGPLNFEAAIDHEVLDRAPDRPSGPRFGTLVHTLLRDVDLNATLEAVQALASVHSTLLDATPEETEAAISAVAGALGHDLLRQAQRSQEAGRCHREPPFHLKLDDGSLLEGIIDLVFRDADGWVVVDFKTDADVEAQRQRYEVQLSWYLFAMERMTGESARGVLLAV